MKRQLLGVAAILLSISTYAQDNPLWMRYCAISPDGTTIAFTYKGDIYTVPSTGGRASQITTNPAHDTKPIWSPDGKKIAFASDRMGSMDIFEVNKEGGIPKRLTISINHTGNTLLYHDKKGYEDPWRKHHTSSITRDIWLCSLNGNRTFRKQTAFNGEDRTPVWASDDKSFYYLSEEKGSFNIFKRDIDGNTSKQITNHTKHPVRFLSAASNGTLCYGYDGEIYTVKEGAIPQKVQISIVTDKNDKDLIRQIKRSGATRNGLWQIYQTSLAKKEEKQFAYATDIKEERLTNSDITSFQPQYSPDGKEVAFLENRTTIRVLNLKSKAVRTVMDGKYEYSYSDGDQWYQWSPDSKWILTNYIGIGGWNNKDVALVNASGNGEIHNLTESGYSDGNAKWVLDGKAMIWESDRAGFRSHGSWGAEADIYIMFFDLDAYDRFRMSKEELALLEDSEKKDKEKSEEKEKADHKKDKKKDSKKEDDKKEVKPLVFDLENSRDRVIRLTVNSSRLGDAVLTPKGDKLYYQAAFESGYDLWEHDLKENKTKIVMKKVGGGALLPDKKGENLFLCSQGGIKKVTVSSGETKPVEFEAFFDYQPYGEREYIFDHVWQQVEDKFYVKDLHGVDWKGYHEAYARFLPYINNNYDFQEMLSEMLGELNGSHTGARYYSNGPILSTATLGVFYDETYDGDGLKIKEILAKGPFAVKKTDVTPGCIIEKIDGKPIVKGQDYFPLLEGKAGRKVLLAIYNPATGKRFDITIKAISMGEQSNLLYKRWVERCRNIVDKLSEGRIGYVHVKGMDSQSFREVYSEVLGRCRNKEAIIVDTRHNGGGWLHDDLATLLSGKEYQRFVPRGQYIGSDPFNKWLKPSCVLVCEDNYSNAHGFPWVYKELKIGKLIGAPVPGTMTAVWWENQIDPSIVFGIPQVGCMDMRGQYAENHQLSPDIEVYNTPEKALAGEDQQLEAAVQEMLKTIGEKK